MTLEVLKALIAKETGVLLYFSGEQCNVCHALRPKFTEAFNGHFPLLKQVFLDAHENPEMAAFFQVFSVPTMIVFLQGKEFAREGRSVSLHQLVRKLERPYNMMIEAES